ncbi:hypothetical protein [Pelosinus sp. sgz500959]|uniref:5'-methylthioadenosine/S-adenosylhomocysteine nucleosidase family protein n=1 Tax=Pelosinus sp. sgz500959 TaxID=3242472 RepID=UPI003671FCEA
MKKILLVGLEYSGADIEQVVIETKGLGEPEICGEHAALPLYEYDVIIINPQSYSHFLFGRATEHSASLKELGSLKKENDRYDFDTVFDDGERIKELNIAISQGAKLVWIAVEDKRESFYGKRTSYQGYLNDDVKDELEHSCKYRKRSTRLKIIKKNNFSGYFESLSQCGWGLTWQPRSKDESWLAETPEGYCLGKEIMVDGSTAWLLTPPTSPEALNVLIKCMLSGEVGITKQKKVEDKVKIKHIPSGDIISHIGRMNLLLVTATEIETRTILKYLAPLDGQEELLEGTIDNLTYRVGKFGAYNAVHFQCGMGTTGRDASTLSTYDAIHKWQPKAIVMIGIACGKDPIKQKIGDVLVSESITAYEPMRIGSKTIPRGPTSLAGQVLLNRFRNMLDWEFMTSPKTKSRMIVGEMLSGDKLIDDQEFKDELFELFPNAIGGEMEGAGVYAAAARLKLPEWIVVKAICDWGDGSKTKESQPLAAEMATSLCHAVFSKPHSFDQLLCQTETVQADVVTDLYKESSSNEILPIDKKLLTEVSAVFTGYKMHQFFEELSNSRSVYLEMMTDFEIGLSRLLAPDKKMRNRDLEEVRSSFLYAIQEFLNFSTTTFSSINNVTARFYGGVSEFQLLTTHREGFDKEDVEYLELIRRIYKRWEELHEQVRGALPDFDWC